MQEGTYVGRGMAGAQFAVPNQLADKRHESAVDSAMSAVEKNLAHLHDRLGALESRLRPVLMPRNETVGTDQCADPTPVNLSTRIGNNAAGINGAANRVCALLDALEL